MRALPNRSWCQLPAWRALIIQSGAAVVTLIVFLLTWTTGLHIHIIFFLMLQGAIATVASRKNRLAPWWLWIQFFFPLIFWMVQSLRLPSVFFLAGFVFLVILYWTTFRSQVPFYPSRHAVWVAVGRLFPPDQSLRMLDAGSGVGGMVIYLAAHHPYARFIGIEAAPLPWLISWIRSYGGLHNKRFIFGNYNHQNFAEYDRVFAYLSPAAMPELWKKARSEMRPGTMLLSYEFAIPEVESHSQLMPEAGGPILHIWHM